MSSRQKKNNLDKIGAGKFLAWQSRGISLGAQIMMCAFLSLYCTTMMGMSAALVGMILMVSKVFDGITDLIAGYVIDRTNTKLGRGRPYELALIGSWITAWMMFSIPGGASMTVKAVWLFFAFTLNQSVFGTLLSANQYVYMVRAFHNENKYVKLNAFGGIIVTIVAVAVNIALPIIISVMGTSAAGWSTMMAYFAVPLCIIGMMRFIFIKEEVQENVKAENKVRLKEMFEVLKSNKYIYYVAFMLLIYNCISNMGVSTYYFTYVVGDLALLSITGIFSVVVLISMLFYPKLLKRVTVKRLIQIGCIVYAAGAALMFIAKDNMVLIILSSLITGIGALPISYMNYQMILDCATYNEWSGHPRMEGTMTSITGFATKIGSALGAGVLGILLSASHFDGALQTQPDSALLMIRMLFSLIPMAFYLILAIVLRFYKLEAKIPQIKAELEARNE